MNTPFIVGALSTVFCTWMLFHAFCSYKKALASKDWPSVKGKINEIELWGKRNVDGQMQEVEKLSIEYFYEVHGKAYKGTTAAFYTLMYPETVNFKKNYPVNSEVSVYYETNNPAESVLIPGPRPGNKRYSDIILASIGLVVSVSVAFFGAIGKFG